MRWVVRNAARTAFCFIPSAMTGFTTSAFLSRNRVSPKEAFEGLELWERKLSCTVLRGLDGSNPVRLLGNSLGRPLGLPCRSSVGCLDCVVVNLLLLHGCGRSVGPLCNFDCEHKNR